MSNTARHGRTSTADGFTLVELMVVVLIIGILVAIAIPVFAAAKGQAQKKTCFANQRSIEGVVVVWQADEPDTNTLDKLAGEVNQSNPLVFERFVHAPYCQSAPHPANTSDPQLGEGAYVLNASGSVLPCTFGAFIAHGSYH